MVTTGNSFNFTLTPNIIMGDISNGTVTESICGRSFSRRQADNTCTVKLEQESAASHVFEPSISRAPIPQATEFFRQPGAAPTGIILE